MSGTPGMDLGPKLPSAKGVANGRNVARMLFRSAYRLSVVGASNVPKRGRLLLAANHTGMVDGPLLLGATPRPVHIFAKSELFTPPLDRLLTSVGQIKLDYESADRRAMSLALDLLSAERAVGIFPEAHRNRGDVARIRHGVAYLYTRSRAPIVPVALLGTRSTGMSKEALPPLRAPLFAVFGEPFSPPVQGDIDQRSTLAAVGELIRQRLADHVAAAVASTGVALPADNVRPT
ncbi:MAG: lysophospholipid acyltransferase family protein [Candidatus Nanopelagicales bacterium]